MAETVVARRVALAPRLEVIEAARAVERLLVDYGSGIDDGDEDLLAGCFAPDGTWELRRDGTVTRRYTTPDELRAWVRRHHEIDHPPHKHVFTNPSISVDADTARATTYFLRVDARPVASEAPPYVLAMGRYEDEVVRCDDGAWRFRSRVAHMEYGPPSPV